MPRNVSKKRSATVSHHHKPLSVLAVASFIFGLLFLTPLTGGIFGVVAIVLGAMALMKIQKHQLGGNWFAIIGIILGAIGVIGMLFL